MKKVMTVMLVMLLAASAVFAQGASDANSGSKTELKTLNVAYMPNYSSLCSVVSAIELGAFEKEGLKINLVEFADGPTIIAAMESGSIDIGYMHHWSSIHLCNITSWKWRCNYWSEEPWRFISCRPEGQESRICIRNIIREHLAAWTCKGWSYNG